MQREKEKGRVIYTTIKGKRNWEKRKGNK